MQVGSDAQWGKNKTEKIVYDFVIFISDAINFLIYIPTQSITLFFYS